MAEHGYRLTEPVIPDGKIRRVNWRPGDRSGGRDLPGWYVAHERDGELAVVVWGDWREEGRHTWAARRESRLSAPELAARRALLEKARAEEEAERARAAESARLLAERILAEARDGDFTHPYLERKRIAPRGLRLRERDSGDELLAPLRCAEGHVRNLQRIHPDGRKLFVKSAPVTGLFWRAGAEPRPDFRGDLAVTEGVATAATVRELTCLTVFAAMHAGNLAAVTAALRSRWPYARILIAADDDRFSGDGSPRAPERNTGLLAAAKAAASVTGALVVPPLWPAGSLTGTDWNDLRCAEGEPEARRRWVRALEMATAAAAATPDPTDPPDDAPEPEGGAPARRKRRARRAAAAAGDTAADDSAPAAPSCAHILTGICASVELWRDQFGNAHATLPHGGALVNTRVEGLFFADWLRLRHTEERGEGTPPPCKKALTSAVEQTAALARLRAPLHPACYRLAWDGEARWLDLGRPDWKAVRLHRDGWEVTDARAVKFIRSGGDCALPLPRRDPALGSGLESLWEILNTAEEDRCLIAGFLLGALNPAAPCFGLNLHGGQGTAKSTATRLLRFVLDPQPAVFQSLTDRSVEDLGLTCLRQWIPCFENVSRLSPETQDVICSLTTSLADRRRKLFTDDEMVSYEIRRPWIINGINNVCTRNDLAERAIPVGLLTVPPSARLRETEVHARFAEIHPHLLAVLLDAAVEAARMRVAARLFLKSAGLTHRMADALEWITAGETMLGFRKGAFIRRLDTLQEEAGFESMDGNPMVETLEWLCSRNSRGYWKGTHEEILTTMWDRHEGAKKDKYMPKDSQGVGNWLRRETERLRKSFHMDVGDRKKAWLDGRRVWQREIIHNRADSPHHTRPAEEDGDGPGLEHFAPDFMNSSH